MALPSLTRHCRGGDESSREDEETDPEAEDDRDQHADDPEDDERSHLERTSDRPGWRRGEGGQRTGRRYPGHVDQPGGGRPKDVGRLLVHEILDDGGRRRL